MNEKSSQKPSNLNEQMMKSRQYDPKDPKSPGALAIGSGNGKDQEKKAEKLKKDLEDFKKKILKKFSFTMSLSVLPAASFKFFEEDEGLVKEEIEKKPLHLIMVIPEDHFKDIQKKIKPEIVKLAHESKQGLWIHIKTPIDVFNYGLDSKFEFLDAIGGSFPLFDNGFLGALRVASIHKSLVLRKFERYVASYVVGGSLVRGTAGKDSDVDTFIVIDDTDVKRMPRLQLLDRLRGMIFDYIREATALAGVKNILNVQVYLLTDFWDNVKDANPVMFTFIRDGIPMYDRGTFLPWKLLLQMGKIKPSSEAVDKFMKYGEQTESLFKKRTLDAMIDIYWGIITPIQALMMLAGHAPPAPKEIVSEVKRVLVDKEKIMGTKELKTLEKAVKLYKEYEHGKLKEISGKDLDILFNEAKEYDKKMNELRKKLEGKLIEHDADRIFDETFDLLKKILGNKSKDALIKDFENELVKKGKMQKKFVSVLGDISSIKTKAKKMSQSEVDRVKRDASELIRELVDYAQRREMVAIEKGVLQVKYGDDKIGELILTDSMAFFVNAGRIKKIAGGRLVSSNPAELEKSLKETKDRVKVSLNFNVLKVLEKELGEFELSI